MKVVVMKNGAYLANVVKTDYGTEYKYTNNRNNALIFNAMGVAKDIASRQDGAEAVMLCKIKEEKNG